MPLARPVDSPRALGPICFGLRYHAPVTGTLEEVDRIRSERDLYRALLELGSTERLESFLQEVLDLIIEVSGARRGYIELIDPAAPPVAATRAATQDQARWWLARGYAEPDIEQVRRGFSRGVIAEALATGRTVVTASAQDDPRFRDYQSVQENRIEAVLCAPIGTSPRLGVVYLQDRNLPGPFTEADRRCLETMSTHLAAFADRLIMRARQHQDPTAAARRGLRAEGLIGRSEALARVLRQISLVAPLDVSVLVTGHSGTGKTQLARIIHNSGPRVAQPFVELSCGALPESLLESELFGALPGAHSTATRRIEGKLAAAEHGTLFLDEIGDMTLNAQTRLLQFLQSKEYFPLGGSKPVRADVRVIAATHVDLKAAVAEKRFREDLFYRLDVVSVHMPGLADRTEDIGDLVVHFCQQSCKTYGFSALHPSMNALAAAQAVEWPGHVRQLAHAVERAVIRAAAEGARELQREHLFPETRDGAAPSSTFQQATRTFQGQLLMRVLQEVDWNVAEAAKRLDLGRSHVYNLIRAFGLGRDREGH